MIHPDKTKREIDDLAHMQRDGELAVPFAELHDPRQSLLAGFRQSVLEAGPGKVLSGAGLGSDFILLQWGEREALVRYIDILRVWVETFDSGEAERLPAGLS